MRSAPTFVSEELKWWTQVRSAFPDMVFDVNLLIEKDDLVVSNWSVRGTHTGTPFYGVAASGKPVEINGTAVLRIKRRQDRRTLGRPALSGRCRSHPLS